MSDTDSTDEPASPCIGVCWIDSNGRCGGCHRTLNEIAGWSGATTEDRRAVIKKCEQRRSSAGQ